MPQHTLTDAEVGRFHRRCDGILENLDAKGLNYDKTVKVMQLVSEGKVAIYNGLAVPDNLLPSTIIRVPRSDSIAYPTIVTRPDRPDLEYLGPKKYDIRDLKVWEYDGLRNSARPGPGIETEELYRNLEDTKLLGLCMDLRDMELIKEKGFGFFCRYYRGRMLMGWKSAVWTNSHALIAPCLYEKDMSVVLDWYNIKLTRITLNSLTLLFQ